MVCMKKPCCFIAGTHILCPDGASFGFARVENLKKDSLVYAVEKGNLILRLARVVETWQRPEAPMIDLTVWSKFTILSVTEDHPVLVHVLNDDRPRIMAASEIKPGMNLLAARLDSFCANTGPRVPWHHASFIPQPVTEVSRRAAAPSYGFRLEEDHLVFANGIVTAPCSCSVPAHV